MTKIGCIIPVRAGSTRVENKNTRKFGEFEGGLLELKLNHLKHLFGWEDLVVSTNDPKAIKICDKMGVKYHVRLDKLCTDETTAAQMIHHATEVFDDTYTDIMWVHVTSPLVEDFDYANMVNDYLQLEGYDGLLTVVPFRNFLLSTRGEVMNNVSKNPWPRTQDLEPLYEVTHSVFITSRDNHIRGSRYGFSPYLYTLPKNKAIDVDWEEDFILAEQMYKLQLQK